MQLRVLLAIWLLFLVYLFCFLCYPSTEILPILSVLVSIIATERSLVQRFCTRCEFRLLLTCREALGQLAVVDDVLVGKLELSHL